MSNVDTSAEAVERLADAVFGVSLAHKARSTCCGECDQSGTCAAPACHFGNVMRALQDSADTLRALLTERDELRAEVERLRQEDAAYNKMNNWPNPDKPGVPLNPERDGWHWLNHPEDLRPMVTGWNAELGGWPAGALYSPQGVVDLGYRYLGPCLTPSEVTAQVDQARREGAEAMREACAAHVMCGCDTAEQAAVMAAATTDGPNSAARWRACHRPDCLALVAAELLDLPLPGGNP